MHTFRERSTGLVISENEFRNKFPDSAFPPSLDQDTLNRFGYDPVLVSPQPTVPITQYTYVAGAIQDAHGNWVQSWVIQDLAPDVVAQKIQQATEAFQRMAVDNVQARLDTFAQTKLYDNIVSACSYATSKNVERAKEGQYCVDARDATWDKLYELQAAIHAGTHPMFADYVSLEAELPVLAWPA